MLKLRNQEFSLKFIEGNIRQRMYQNESIVTLVLHIEFYPELMNDSIIYGSIEVKVDLNHIHSLHDLENKHYEGDIGNVTISISNNGVWESESIDHFSVSFGKLKKREIEINIETKEFTLEDKAILVSLYTTSTSLDDLNKVFDLKEFYSIHQKYELGKSTILKYYLK